MQLKTKTKTKNMQHNFQLYISAVLPMVEITQCNDTGRRTKTIVYNCGKHGHENHTDNSDRGHGTYVDVLDTATVLG